MPIDYKQFIHPEDAKALEALKALRGFDALAKEFMHVINERQYYIQNMSTHIRLSPEQMPNIYNLLPPICEKLGIAIPDLYLSLDRIPNAYTSGDTDVFIVLTSGLVETLTTEEIQVVLAHECGHILCHHVLYHTMARFLLSAGSFVFPSTIGKLLTSSLQLALLYWVRRSEFSADRVSAFFAGSSELVSDVMLRLAGGTTTLNCVFNKKQFLDQAKEYKDSMDDSTVNKAFEFLMYKENSHPLLAYRAYEITEWCKTNEFANLDATIRQLAPENQKNQYFDSLAVDVLYGKDLMSWFKTNNLNNGYKNLIVDCAICKENTKNFLKHLKRLSFNPNRTVYQALIDANDNTVKYRLVTFNKMDDRLKQAFIEKDGYIFVD